MIAIVLVHPEIPPNTGNVIRLAANTGAELHLVEPLGFRLDDRELKRAGLDYHEYTRVVVHHDWAACRSALGATPRRWYALTTRGANVAVRKRALGRTMRSYSAARPAACPTPFSTNSAAESRLRIPMRPALRSLNLSNAVAITVYEAWRQAGFSGAAERDR